MEAEGRSRNDRIIADLEPVLRRTGLASVVRDLRPFGSGHSGFTYAVDTGEEEPLILRLSPPGVRISGPADVGRQGRIMSALHASGLPVPRIYASSTEPEIDGSSYALMERVIGVDWEDAVAEYGGVHVATETIRTLRLLAEIGIEQSGIGDEPAVGPVDELDRWSSLLTRAPDHLHARGTQLEVELRRSVPTLEKPAVVHGDFHLANVIFAAGRVVAIVDWEIAEIGQSLVDLGALTLTTLRHRYYPDPNPSGELGLSPADIVALYGASEEAGRWYTALSCLKYAAIIGYNFQLHRRGRRPDPLYERQQTTMSGLLDDGLLIADKGLDSVVRAGAADLR